MPEFCDEKRVREKYRELTLRLIRGGLTVSTMESATSGQIASLITDTEGASAVLKGAFITYSNEAKIREGVPEEVIRRYGVYSEQTAIAMAARCAEAYRADIGIGMTGTLGSIDPANPECSVPGRIFFAVCFRGEVHAFTAELAPEKSRLLYKLSAAEKVCDELRKLMSQ